MDPGALYRRFLLDLWHADPARLPDLATELVTPDFVIRRRGGASELSGPPAAADLISQSHALFDDIRVTLDIGPLVTGEYVAGRWTFHGAYRGGIPGATAPAGTSVAFSGHDIVRVAGKLVAEYWVTSEADHLMEQLGAG